MLRKRLLIAISLASFVAEPLWGATFAVSQSGGSGSCYFVYGGDQSPTPLNVTSSCTDSPLFPPYFLLTSTAQSRAELPSLGAKLDWTIVSNGGSSISPVGGYAGAFASDDIIVSGGIGTGVLRVVASVDGTVSSLTGPAGTSAYYRVQMTTSAAGTLNSVFQWQDVVGTGTQEFGSLELLIPFAYDTPFFFSREFQVGVGIPGLSGLTAEGPYGGVADFYNSAAFSFSVFDDQMNPMTNATVVSDTGYVYVAPVPIPAAGWLLASALGLLGRFRRKQATQ